MVFDEAAAERAFCALVAITDDQQIAEIGQALDAAIAAWRTWRCDPDYPAPGDPVLAIMSTLDTAVNEAAEAVAALPARPAVHTISRIAGPIVAPDVSEHAGAAAFSSAADRLRWLAVQRPRLVTDARQIHTHNPGSSRYSARHSDSIPDRVS